MSSTSPHAVASASDSWPASLLRVLGGLAVAVRAVEPAAQLAFLAAGQPRDLARLLALLLDQRERLQHGVVQVRGDLGAFVGADAGLALVGEVADQPQPERHGQHGHPDQRRDDGDQGELDLVEAAAAEHDDADAGDHQRDAGDDPDGGRPAAPAEERPGEAVLRADLASGGAATRRPRARRRRHRSWRRPSGTATQPLMNPVSVPLATARPTPSAIRPNACWRSFEVGALRGFFGLLLDEHPEEPVGEQARRRSARRAARRPSAPRRRAPRGDRRAPRRHRRWPARTGAGTSWACPGRPPASAVTWSRASCTRPWSHARGVRFHRGSP